MCSSDLRRAAPILGLGVVVAQAETVLTVKVALDRLLHKIRQPEAAALFQERLLLS